MNNFYVVKEMKRECRVKPATEPVVVVNLLSPCNQRAKLQNNESQWIVYLGRRYKNGMSCEDLDALIVPVDR